MKEDAGQKIAEIDAHVGRVSAGLDETMLVLNDRIAGMDSKFVEADRRMDGIEQSIEGVDANALDELKEKMSSAVGEAMLVRIEMERLEKGVNERTDSLAVRMTDVETQVQDATMDVSTSVQLDRLEEIERTLIELDPNQFVRKDELENQKTVKNSSADADAFDIQIVACPHDGPYCRVHSGRVSAACQYADPLYFFIHRNLHLAGSINISIQIPSRRSDGTCCY
jgi:SMC interacting uncharacterized protein involved in chromosome segregation